MSTIKSMQRRKKPASAQRRAEPLLPEIYVKLSDKLPFDFARAHIRVKAGQYQYLVWRDGGRVRNFYLGKKRIS